MLYQKEGDSMKPLGYLIYLKNHKKRISSVVITIALCIVLIGSLDVITKNILQTQKRDFAKFNYFTLINPGDGALSKSTLDEISNYEGVDRVIRVGTFQCDINTIGSQAEYKSFAMEPEDMKYIMNRMQLVISNGTLPQMGNSGIAVNENIARAFRLKVGDYVDPKKDSVTGLLEKYKISGIMKGDNVIAFIPMSMEEIQNNPIFKEEYMVVFKDGKMKDVNSFLKSGIHDNIKILGMDENIDFVNMIFKNYNSLINLMVILTIAFLSVVLGNHSYVHYIHRRREFGILKAIGVNKNKLLLKVGTEITITTFTSMVLGILLLFAIDFVLNRAYILNIGLAPLTVKPDLLLKLIPIPLSISIFTFIPVSRMIDKIDAITIIERVS